MNLGQAHLSVKYEGREGRQLCGVLIDFVDPEHFNGTENFEVSDTEMVAFFYDGGYKGSPIETSYFYVTGEPGTCETTWRGEKQEYECFHIDEIREISKDEAERFVGLS